MKRLTRVVAALFFLMPVLLDDWLSESIELAEKWANQIKRKPPNRER